MKKSSIVCLAGLFLFVACENNNSSTVGTYDKEETAQEEHTTAHDKDSVTTDVIIGPRIGDIPDSVNVPPQHLENE